MSGKIQSESGAVEKAIERVKLYGPDRVIVDAAGQAVSPVRLLESNRRVDFVLIRNDGWALGGERELYEVARELWAGDWAVMLSLPSRGVCVSVKIA